MSKTDMAKYPKFAQYVKTEFPKLVNIPKVVQGVAKFGALNRTAFHRAMEWDMPPTITITDLHNGQCSVPKAYGCFRGRRPEFIEIHVGTVNDFEVASKTDTSAAGHAVYVAGATHAS